jgi:hypothetical protein
LRATTHALQQYLRVFVQRRRGLVAITDADAAADIDMLQFNAFAFKAGNQFQHAVQRFAEGCDFGQLRTDVTVDAGDA